MRGPFESRPDGSIAARLSDQEADVLRRVADDLLSSLQDTAEPSLGRLFPRAYATDEHREADFASMTRDDLVDGKRAAARSLIASLDAGTKRRGRWTAMLDAETAGSWLGVINDARLILGVRLEISEETDYTSVAPSDPRAPAMNLYFYLSALQEALIDALAAGPQAEATS